MRATTSNNFERIQRAHKRLNAIPSSLIALLGRFSISAVFWLSGETKVDGFELNLIAGTHQFGWPHINDSTMELFRTDYRLPFIPPEVAAPMAAFAEHFFPVLLLFGFATRLSAAALLGMTAVIEIFVYPDAYPVHGTWATILIYLIATGGGKFSIDRLIERWFARA